MNEKVSNNPKKRKHHHPRVRQRKAPGTSPGTIKVEPDAATPVISVLCYNRDTVIEKQGVSIDELPTVLRADCRIWIDIDGLGDPTIIQRIGEIFQLHPLALEDVASHHQRPKVEEYDESLFVVARMPTHNDAGFATEQLTMFIKSGVLITFQEIPGGDCFGLVRDRIRKGKGKIRERGADYLGYALLDAVIDYYYPLLERFGDELEQLEDRAISDPSPEVISQVHILKQHLLGIRRTVWPMREALNTLIRDESHLIADETRLYLRDCYDHAFQILDLVETYREICADIRDIYLSSISNRMNEVMKVLTIIATIFIPLTFIAGVYGMNFDPESSPWNMPELKAQYGYPICLGAMLLVTLGLLGFFRRRRWI